MQKNFRPFWGKHHFLITLLILSALLLPVLSQAQNQGQPPPQDQPLKKKVVALKLPTLGDGVGKNSQKNLNLGELLAEMEASILATKKFEVVTRQKDKLGAIREEQGFADSGFAKGDAAEEGQFKNANYLILPVVQHFAYGRSCNAVPNIDNKYSCGDSGGLEIGAQLVDTTTGNIYTTFYLKSSFSTGASIVNSSGGGPGSSHFTTMAKSVSAQMADQLIDWVFPMQVINVVGTQVWINRGSDGGLKADDVLNVYKPGTELVDPDTHESLGSAEKLIGRIKVSRVNPKSTIAEILTKDTQGPIKNEFIIRKPQK